MLKNKKYGEYTMKRNSLLMKMVIAVSILCTFTACGPIGGSSSSQNPNAVQTSEASSSTAETMKPAECDVGENGKKAVSHVTLIPDGNMDISEKVRFTDMYGKHVLHSGVVGLVGAPVDIDYDSNEIKSGTLIFTYEPDKLEGVRTDALMFMWYDEAENNYVELAGETLDEPNHTISIKIDKPGVYLLVNKYRWFKTWGADITDTGLEDDYNPLDAEYSSEVWEANAYTGDIVKLADAEYIRSCVDSLGATFKVSTPEQLASAVYFVNCVAQNAIGDRPHVNIELQNDIDLSGIKWAPMGWETAGVDYTFSGTINGNGHTISSMKINPDSGISGFIGKGSYCQVSDINFKDADVYGNICGIIIGSDSNSRLSNCFCQGTVKGSLAGSMLGKTLNTTITDCKADVTVNDEKENDYLSYTSREKQKVIDKTEITETISIDENKIIYRDKGIEKKYRNISWSVTYEGCQALDRIAEDETEFHFLDFFSNAGHYTVTLTAFIDGYYIPISNTIEIDI